MSFISVKSQLSQLRRNQAGIAHLGLIAVVVAAISIIGFVGYNIYQKNSSSAATATKPKTITVKDKLEFEAKQPTSSKAIPVSNSGLSFTTKVSSSKKVNKPCPQGKVCAAVMVPVETVGYTVVLQKQESKKGVFFKKAPWVDTNQKVVMNAKNGEQKSHLFSGLAAGQYRLKFTTTDTGKLTGTYELSASKFATTTPSAGAFGKEQLPATGAKDVISKTFTAELGAIQVRTYFSQPKVCRDDVKYAKPCVEPAAAKYDVWIEQKVGDSWKRVSAIKRGDANHKKYVRDVIPFDNAIHRDGSQYRARFSSNTALYGSFTVDVLRTSLDNIDGSIKVQTNTKLQTVQPAPVGSEQD